MHVVPDKVLEGSVLPKLDALTEGPWLLAGLPSLLKFDIDSHFLGSIRYIHEGSCRIAVCGIKDLLDWHRLRHSELPADIDTMKDLMQKRMATPSDKIVAEDPAIWVVDLQGPATVVLPPGCINCTATTNQSTIVGARKSFLPTAAGSPTGHSNLSALHSMGYVCTKEVDMRTVLDVMGRRGE